VNARARPWMLALAVAIPLTLAYLVWMPPAADLAAATYRSDLFARVGFQLRDNGWYAAHGFYLLGYSLLSPALGALLGVRVLLALSVLAACTLFGLISERVFGLDRNPPARVAAIVFALGFCVELLSGRVPYDLGFAIGLGSVLALLHGRLVLALALALLTSAASPIAGAFLALAGLAYALADLETVRKLLRSRCDTLRRAGSEFSDSFLGPFPREQGSRQGFALAAAALLPIVVLAARARVLQARVLPRYGMAGRAAPGLAVRRAYLAYRLVRGLVEGDANAAFAHARDLISLERTLHVFVEPSIQAWASGSHALMDFSSWMYVNAQTTVTVGALVYLYLRHNRNFYFVRNMFMIAMAIALVGYTCSRRRRRGSCPSGASSTASRTSPACTSRTPAPR
jgi:hypothetical protein